MKPFAKLIATALAVGSFAVPAAALACESGPRHHHRPTAVRILPDHRPYDGRVRLLVPRHVARRLLWREARWNAHRAPRFAYYR